MRTIQSRRYSRFLFLRPTYAYFTAEKYAYVGRKNKKREYRRLWIVRINAAARENGLTYSQLMRGLKAAGVTLDRKMLADMAATQSAAFAKVAAQAKAALPAEARA